jgi:hypothetical protein
MNKRDWVLIIVLGVVVVGLGLSIVGIITFLLINLLPKPLPMNLLPKPLCFF